jgi:hypothetical protein
MKKHPRLRAKSGSSLISAILATTIFGLTAGVLIQQANTLGQVARDANSRIQEDSYKLYQSELALFGVDPTTLSYRPVAGTQEDNPTLDAVTGASNTTSGNAQVQAYKASFEGRAQSVGFRILTP